jgi:hypothetical protein
MDATELAHTRQHQPFGCIGKLLSPYQVLFNHSCDFVSRVFEFAYGNPLAPEIDIA